MKICRLCQQVPAVIPSALGLCESCLNLWAGTTMVEIEDQETPQKLALKDSINLWIVAFSLIVTCALGYWLYLVW